MEVFVQEPSMDWLMFARINKDSERGEKEEWYPQQKLNLAKMKLNGANPAIITKIELESRSKMDPDTLQSIIAVAVGNPNENIRAQYPDHHLDPDQQVRKGNYEYLQFFSGYENGTLVMLRVSHVGPVA
ncbi:hypothetical protein C0J52_28353 [Blattella germanica]|nr:hypothetical protein C0J52_28353 [Blattella germanica]